MKMENIIISYLRRILMEYFEVWNKINLLQEDNNDSLSYEQIPNLMKKNPDKILTYFDALFIEVSIQRMKQLARISGYGELSLNHFNSDSLGFAWRLIRSQYNCPFKEYTNAIEFIEISKKKFKRNLSANEARTAYECLMYISDVWVKSNLVFIKKPNTPALNMNEGEEDAKARIAQLKKTERTVIEPANHKSDIEVTEDTEPIEVHSSEPSEFIKILSVLQSSSKESVVNSDSFGYLRDYMHVKRPIQEELEELLGKVKKEGKPNLILLCGSVGDGKSHLLAFMKVKRPDLLEDVIVHNDSTESFDPTQNSLEALEHVLLEFNGNSNADKTVIIAINLGVLHNFYHRQKEKGGFKELCDFIDNSGVFQRPEGNSSEHDSFKLLNFAERQPYLLTSEGARSPFFLELIEKVTTESEHNPFYVAWIRDKRNEISSPAHVNYELLQQSAMKESITQSLIEAMIKQKVFVSTRTFYNFLYEIILPVNNKTHKSKLSMNVDEMLPNLMYGHPDRSPLLAALDAVDPLKKRLETTDKLVSEFILSSNPSSCILEVLGEDTLKGAWKYVDQMAEKEQQIQYSQLLIRHHTLLYKRQYDEAYREYIAFLYSFYTGDESEIGNLFGLVEKVIFEWKGSPRDKFIFMDSPNKNFRIAVEISIEPEVDEQTFGISCDIKEVDRFSPSIKIGFNQRGESYLFELDFQLYLLLKKVSDGYRPNRQDMQNALQFSEFHDKIIKSADKTKHVLLVHKLDGAILEIKKPRFSKAKFEVEKVN